MKIYYWTPEFPLKIKGGTLQGHVQCVKGEGGGGTLKQITNQVVKNQVRKIKMSKMSIKNKGLYSKL